MALKGAEVTPDDAGRIACGRIPRDAEACTAVKSANRLSEVLLVDFDKRLNVQFRYTF
jgi:hypothetical protein